MVFTGKIARWFEFGEKGKADFDPIALTEDFIKELLSYDVILCLDYYRFTAEACSVHPNVFLALNENIPYNPLFEDDVRTWISEIIHPNVRHFMALAPCQRDALLVQGVDPSRISVIPFWSCDTETFMPMGLTFSDKCSVRTKYGIDFNSDILFCVADDGETKGLDYLMKAFNVMGDCDLVIAGKGNVDRYMTYLDESKVSRVHHVGWLDQKELAYIYNVASVYLQPSVPRHFCVEQFGRAVTEAMACGLPCVVSDVGGMSSIVEDGITGFLVPPADLASIVNKVEYLLSDRRAIRRMGFAGRKKVEEIYSREIVNDQMADCYARYMQPQEEFHKCIVL